MKIYLSKTCVLYNFFAACDHFTQYMRTIRYVIINLRSNQSDYIRAQTLIFQRLSWYNIDRCMCEQWNIMRFNGSALTPSTLTAFADQKYILFHWQCLEVLRAFGCIISQRNFDWCAMYNCFQILGMQSIALGLMLSHSSPGSRICTWANIWAWYAASSWTKIKRRQIKINISISNDLYLSSVQSNLRNNWYVFLLSCITFVSCFLFCMH